MRSDFSKLLTQTIEIARTAGSKIMETYQTYFDIAEKSDQSPVTEADLIANHVIIDGLAEITPSIPTLSEESDPVPFSERKNWKQYWLIDPLDGTREFIKRSDQFTVNIALIKNHTPILAVIQVPAEDTVYYASQGMGAFKKCADKEPVKIRTNKTNHDEFVMLIGNHAIDNRTLNAFRDHIGKHKINRVGSSLKSCLIAEGKADVYPRFGPTCEWDTAAAQCIVEEAGGKMTDIMLRPLRYNTKESLLNPYFIAFGNAKKDWSRILKNILHG